MSRPSIELQSPPFLGVPLIVKLLHPRGYDDWHYAAVYIQNSRKSWNWLRDKRNGTVTLNSLGVEDLHGQQDAEIELRYYVDGGYVATGTVAATSKIRVRNPVRSILATVDLAQHLVRIQTVLEATPENSDIRITSSNVRLCAYSVLGAASRTTQQLLSSGGAKAFSLPIPRVPGTYEVRFTSNDSVLAKTHVTVGGDPVHMALSLGAFETTPRPPCSTSGALVVARSTPIYVKCFNPSSLPPNRGASSLPSNSPPFQGLRVGKDCIFVTALPNLVTPSASVIDGVNLQTFQAPKYRVAIQANGTAEVRIVDEGLYQISVALHHEAGTFLCAAWGVVLVSDLCNEVSVGNRQRASPAGSLPVVQPSPASSNREDQYSSTYPNQQNMNEHARPSTSSEGSFWPPWTLQTVLSAMPWGPFGGGSSTAASAPPPPTPPEHPQHPLSPAVGPAKVVPKPNGVVAEAAPLATTTASANSAERLLCVICHDSIIQIKLDPCRHVVLCSTCFEFMRRGDARFPCPICRQPITGSEKIFLP